MDGTTHYFGVSNREAPKEVYSKQRLAGQHGLAELLKVYLLDRHGDVREIYSTSFLNPDVLLNDIRTLLMEG